jgi:hypothetical protein
MDLETGATTGDSSLYAERDQQEDGEEKEEEADEEDELLQATPRGGQEKEGGEVQEGEASDDVASMLKLEYRVFDASRRHQDTDSGSTTSAITFNRRSIFFETKDQRILEPYCPLVTRDSPNAVLTGFWAQVTATDPAQLHGAHLHTRPFVFLSFRKPWRIKMPPVTQHGAGAVYDQLAVLSQVELSFDEVSARMNAKVIVSYERAVNLQAMSINFRASKRECNMFNRLVQQQKLLQAPTTATLSDSEVALPQPVSAVQSPSVSPPSSVCSGAAKPITAQCMQDLAHEVHALRQRLLVSERGTIVILPKDATTPEKHQHAVDVRRLDKAMRRLVGLHTRMQNSGIAPHPPRKTQPPPFRDKNAAHHSKDMGRTKPSPVFLCLDVLARLPAAARRLFETDPGIHQFVTVVGNTEHGNRLFDAAKHRKSRVTWDGGVKVFGTYVTHCGDVFEFGGAPVTDRLHQLLERDSFLQSQVDHAVCAGRTNWAKRLRIQRVQLKAKMRKIVTATHKYAALFAASFDLNLYAALETTSIVSCKRARPLDSLSKRMALTWRHADYGRRLRKTCAESGCRIWDVPEVCSTVLCSHCGRRSPVGRARVFRCANRDCGGGSHYTSGRDVDGGVCTEAISIGGHARLMYLDLSVGESAAGPKSKRPRPLNTPGPQPKTTVPRKFCLTAEERCEIVVIARVNE